MNKISFILETDLGKVVTKSKLFDSEEFDLGEIIEMFYTLVSVDIGVDSVSLDRVLKNWCSDSKKELNEFPSITDSTDFLIEINSNPGFRDFMYDLYKLNILEVN